MLVLKRRGRSLWHIAVVTRINGPRDIIVDHANWLNRGRIHLGTPVRDMSKNNDWSAARVFNFAALQLHLRRCRWHSGSPTLSVHLLLM